MCWFCYCCRHAVFILFAFVFTVCLSLCYVNVLLFLLFLSDIALVVVSGYADGTHFRQDSKRTSQEVKLPKCATDKGFVGGLAIRLSFLVLSPSYRFFPWNDKRRLVWGPQ